MIQYLVLGAGLVLVIEGLVIALAPDRIEDLMKMLSDVPVETRRYLGLGAISAGVFLIWLTRGVLG